MSARPDQLPEFANPPVVEVVLSLQFERVELTSLLFARMWERFRERFPRVEEHPPLPPSVERFDPASAHPELRVQILPAQFVPRYWLLSETGNELVQVQSDRFIYNWRKVLEGDVYPRYAAMRHAFEQELARFHQFVTEEGLGDLHVVLLFVRFTERISDMSDGQTLTDLGRGSRVLAKRLCPSLDMPCTAGRFTRHWILTEPLLRDGAE